MNCRYCQAETTNGLALCERCQIAASVYLEFLPVHFRNLARWRPGQAGSRPVPGSRIPKGVIPERGDAVGNALNEVGGDLDTWATCLVDDRGVDIPAAEGEASIVRVLCWAFSENLTSIATLEWAGEFVRALTVHEARLRKLAERFVPGWYAGACRQCGTSTHVVPGQTWVTCGGCGAATYARDHLETVLDEARSWVAPPMRLAEAVVALVDTELSVPRLYERIKKWGQRDKVECVRSLDRDGDPIGAKRYRMGEVLDLLQREGSTRTSPVEAQAS